MTDNQVLPRHRPIIRLFVSSTFTDFKHERDVLQREVFLKLERHCAKRQFQFHAVDLRWGVPTEANKDHRTMRICFEELRRSQEISPQPNFLILLGNRYGWQPLPEEISTDEYKALEDNARTDEARHILSQWYRCDDNAISPVHFLRSRKDEVGDGVDYTDDDNWKPVQKILWDIINDAFPASDLSGRFSQRVALDQPLPSIVRFQASATEQEIWRGALGAPNAKEHVLAFIREIENLADFPQAEQIGQFVDVEKHEVNAVSQTALNDLKTEVIKRLGDGNIITSDPVRLLSATDKDGKPSADVSTEHLPEMCTRIYTALESIIDRQMNEYWDTEGTDVAPSRLLELERNEHRLFGRERAPKESFVGRQRHLETIGEYIENQTQGPLVIHGASGCGKTALLARAAQEVAPERRPIVRFIGVTPHTSDIRSLLSSLCQELRERHPIDSPLPTDYQPLAQELLQHFNTATADEPVILYLDALDQLADSDDGRSLHWLPTDLLPEHAKVIVSCLSERAPEDPAGRPYAALRERVIADKNFINLDALTPEEARELLFDRWLPQAGRRLDSEQSETVARQMEMQSCRAPLYLKILFEEARLWRSSEPVPKLGDDVPALLGDLLDLLGDSSNHGITVERALGYIASARRGLAESEILEVLYRDPEYKLFLDRITEKTGHTLPDNPPRIPIAIWARLRSDLAPYLSEQAAPGATVLNFYHRQMSETVRARFLKGEKRCRLFHTALSEYFDNRDLDSRKVDELPRQLSKGSAWRRLRKLLWDRFFNTSLSEYFDNRDLDSRKIDELPWQLSKGSAWRRLCELLSDRNFFKQVWQQNKFDTMGYWASVEASSILRKVDAYQGWIDHPEAEADTDFLWLLGMLLGDTGHPEEALKLRSELVEHFKKSGDQNSYQASLGNQAGILYSRGDLDGAMALYKEQERICRQLGNLDSLSASLGGQALILKDRGDLDGAMALHKEQERICRQLGNLDSLQISLGNQALILKSRGDLDGAMALHKEKERICRQLGNLDSLSASLGNQALILKSRGDLDGAMALHKEEERICRQLGNLDSLQISLGNQALILKSRGDLDGAMALHKEEERMCRQLGNLDGLQRSLGNQALILQSRGDLDGAMALHKEEERICRQLGNLDSLSISLGNQALILKSRGDLDGAMALMKEQERICRQLGNLDSLQRSLGNQALILKSRGDLDGAMALLKEKERICRQLGNLDSLSISLGNQALILQSRGDLDGAMALLKEQERICRQLGNVNGLAISLANQSVILANSGRVQEGLSKIEEAHQMAVKYGYTALAAQIEPVLNAIRQAAKGSKQ